MEYRKLSLLFDCGFACIVPLRMRLHRENGIAPLKSGSKMPASRGFTMQTVKMSKFCKKEK